MAFLFYFERMKQICLNGNFISCDQPVLFAANRGFRYGDALFETIKVFRHKMPLAHYHFERLFHGISLLKFIKTTNFTAAQLENEILELCEQNQCKELARVRLTVFRGNGNLFDIQQPIQYLIEAEPAAAFENQLNTSGLVIDIFTDVQKSCDKFSHLKSANYLPFVMASLFAKENNLDDCLLLNVQGRICESSIANVFWLKDDVIYTPPVSEGCVAGVMRRYLIENAKALGYKMQEQLCSIADIEKADEVFLTNAVQGIRWVKQFRDNTYPSNKIQEIHRWLVKALYS
jgi:branched-chain amino acid aminotransferase